MKQKGSILPSTGECAVCLRRYSLRNDGKVRLHRGVPVGLSRWCEGSLTSPLPASILVKGAVA